MRALDIWYLMVFLSPSVYTPFSQAERRPDSGCPFLKYQQSLAPFPVVNLTVVVVFQWPAREWFLFTPEVTQQSVLAKVLCDHLQILKLKVQKPWGREMSCS